MSAVSGQTVTVDYTTTNATAVAGTDYEAASGTLTFDPGVTSRTVTVTVTGDAIDEGIGEALKRVSSNATDPSGLDGVVERVEEGWAGLVGMFGSGAEMRGRYMARAVAAMMGLYGNDAVEAYYPTSSSDESGNRYDGSRHSYVLRFEKDEMPPVEAFWSMTVYSLPGTGSWTVSRSEMAVWQRGQ